MQSAPGNSGECLRVPRIHQGGTRNGQGGEILIKGVSGAGPAWVHPFTGKDLFPKKILTKP